MTETEMAFAKLQLTVAINAIDEVIKKLSETGAGKKPFPFAEVKMCSCGFYNEFVKDGVVCCTTCGTPKT